jgi:hypothetical protein
LHCDTSRASHRFSLSAAKDFAANEREKTRIFSLSFLIRVDLALIRCPKAFLHRSSAEICGEDFFCSSFTNPYGQCLQPERQQYPRLRRNFAVKTQFPFSR